MRKLIGRIIYTIIAIVLVLLLTYIIYRYHSVINNYVIIPFNIIAVMFALGVLSIYYIFGIKNMINHHANFYMIVLLTRLLYIAMVMIDIAIFTGIVHICIRIANLHC
mgnify:CR=1 FL=1